MAGERLPLKGLRVADFFWLIAGPATSRVLADLGAEVIKIETQTRYDQIRIGGRWAPNAQPDTANAVFSDCNTNKRSITLNLNSPRGRDLARDLVRRSDIVTNNFTGGRMARWGLAYDDLVEVKRDIIMISMPVMGTTGPYRDYGANGNGVIAYGGLDTSMGFPGRPPIGMGPLYSDFATPYFAVSALMAALHHRERTGEGQFIDLSQLQATVSLLGTDVLEYTANRQVREPDGNHARDFVPHAAYPCWGSDRWCAIAVRTDEEWRSLCTAMELSALADRLPTASLRRAHEEELDRTIAGWTVERDAWQIVHQLQAVGVMAAVVENIEDMVVRDPHLSALHFVTVRDREHGVTYTTHGQPMRIDGSAVPLRRAPVMGEDNEYVFKEILGVSDADYADLLADQTIY